MKNKWALIMLLGWGEEEGVIPNQCILQGGMGIGKKKQYIKVIKMISRYVNGLKNISSSPYLKNHLYFGE